MEQTLVEALISTTLEKAFGSKVKINTLSQIQERRERQVHRLTVEGLSDEPVTLFSKTGSHFYIQLESALYQRVFSTESMETPKLIAASEQDGVHCFIIDEVKGQPIDYGNLDHVKAAFLTLARFHNHNRQYIHKMEDIFTNPRGRANNNPNPQMMFDRIKDVWDRAISLGLKQDEFDIFYNQEVMDLILSEEPTFVHGDVAADNMFIDLNTMTVRCFDFGYSAIRAATSDFMYFFGSESIFGNLLEPGLHYYWQNSDQGVSYSEFKIRHAYWHASCKADALSWKLNEADLNDEEIRRRKVSNLEAIQQASQCIKKLLDRS